MIDSGPAGAVFSLLIRYVHLVAAVAWVGGSLFYLVALFPGLRDLPDEWRLRLEQRTGKLFREMVQTAIVALLITGVLLSVERLTGGIVGPIYAVVLGVKIALSLVMFGLAWRLRRGRRPRPPVAPRDAPSRTAPALLVLGLIVLLLALLLRALYEGALRGLI